MAWSNFVFNARSSSAEPVVRITPSVSGASISPALIKKMGWPNEFRKLEIKVDEDKGLIAFRPLSSSPATFGGGHAISSNSQHRCSALGAAIRSVSGDLKIKSSFEPVSGDLPDGWCVIRVGKSKVAASTTGGLSRPNGMA